MARSLVRVADRECGIVIHLHGVSLSCRIESYPFIVHGPSRYDGTMENQRRWNPAIIFVALLGATMVVLRGMGRNWWCSCGSPIPWSWDIWSMHNSQHLIDPYFFTHVLHGVILFAVLGVLPIRLPAHTRFLIAVVLECGWEILENSPMIIDRYRTVTISLDYYGDSISNSIADIVACAIGYLLASIVRPRWWLAMIVAVELVLLITIRDCLTLNIIMLIYPLDAIMQWQTS